MITKMIVSLKNSRSPIFVRNNMVDKGKSSRLMSYPVFHAQVDEHQTIQYKTVSTIECYLSTTKMSLI